MIQSAITIKNLLGTLRSHADLPVTFTLGEISISQGYHLTEIKLAAVESLDCQSGSDQWHELVIQLLDGNAQSTAGYMQAYKMLGILDKAIDQNPLIENAKLYFEFSPGNTSMMKSDVASIDVIDNKIYVSLINSTAQCKPFQRWLESADASNTSDSCCGGNQVKEPVQSCCTPLAEKVSCCS
jgi:hypothetical protein